MTQLAATAPGVMALHKSGNALLPFSLSLFFFLSWGLNRFHTLHAAGFVRVLIAELWSVLECSIEDARVVRPKVTPMEPIDRNCLKVPCLTCNVNNSLFEAIFFFNHWIQPSEKANRWRVNCVLSLETIHSVHALLVGQLAGYVHKVFECMTQLTHSRGGYLHSKVKMSHYFSNVMVVWVGK